MKSSIVAGLLSLGAVANAAAANPLAGCLNGKKVPVSWISSPNYENLTEPFNLRLVYKPVVVVLPTTNKHVQDAVVCASQSKVKVQAKSGGHSYASYSSGGKDGSMSKSHNWNIMYMSSNFFSDRFAAITGHQA
jgi:hypothetical protein